MVGRSAHHLERLFFVLEKVTRSYGKEQAMLKRIGIGLLIATSMCGCISDDNKQSDNTVDYSVEGRSMPKQQPWWKGQLVP